MANKFTYQILRDTTTDAVIKLTGTFDGTSGQEANNSRIQANSLFGALDANNNLLTTGNTAKSYYDLQITGVKAIVNFTTAGTGAVEMFWNGAGATSAAQYANSATYLNHIKCYAKLNEWTRKPLMDKIQLYTMGQR